MVSFCAPQEEPARALRMWRWEEAREMMSEIWGEKEKWVSRVTRGVLQIFKGKELIVKKDLRMGFGLSVVGSENCDRGFVWGNG